jgi:hypothetical protein
MSSIRLSGLDYRHLPLRSAARQLAGDPGPAIHASELHRRAEQRGHCRRAQWPLRLRVGPVQQQPCQLAVDERAGTLTPIDWAPTGGNSPRFFCLDPAAKFLYAANADEGFGPPEEKNTDTIVQFALEANGTLKPTGQIRPTARARSSSPAYSFRPCRVLSALDDLRS